MSVDELVEKLRDRQSGLHSYECERIADKLEELAAENERLRGINANLMGDDEDAPRYTTKRMRQEVHNRVEAALAEKDKEISALREALEDAMAGIRYVRQVYGDLVGVGFNRVEERGREALSRNAGGTDAE